MALNQIVIKFNIMKNKIIISVLLLLISFCGFTQQQNSIKYSQVLINNNSINQSKANLIINLNLFNTGEFYINELANEDAEIYIQNNSVSQNPSQFYFKNDKLYNFNLTDNQYYLNHSNIKVGNNISYVDINYPLSFASKYEQDAIGFIIIELKMEDDSLSDEVIVINYNSATEIITSIHITSR
jgi:hypothetical protein